MGTLKQIGNFLDGKKRSIAALAGAVLPWCYEYHVLPDQYLKLAAIGVGLMASWGVGHAVKKSIAARNTR